MIRHAFVAGACLLALDACAAGAETPRPALAAASFASALLAGEPQPALPAAAAAAPGSELSVAAASASCGGGPPEPPAPAERVAAANRAAAREPSQAGYVNAVQVYPYARGALFRLYTTPEYVSEIALQPGETLVSVAAGDTVRWVIGETISGAGEARRNHILVKPTAAGLRTNLLMTTDRRVYHLEMESTRRTAMASVSWTYPEDELLALRRAHEVALAAAPVADSIRLEALEFGYRIEGDDPPWRPLRAFDDGRQVFILFPESLGRGEAPPLFVLGGEGRGELVNYRIRGNYYVVDRLFEAAELRLGEDRQQSVRIVRTGGGGRRTRSGS